jgi:hypothetical protein
MGAKRAKRFSDEAKAMTVRIAAARLGVQPRTLSDVLAAIDPRGEVVPVVQRRRRLSPDQLADLRAVLESRGILPPRVIV